MFENLQVPKKKKRIGAPKSRRGCLTCKIRHKKCDEKKPCTPCTSTGRTCDFIKPPTTTSTPPLKLPLRPQKKKRLPSLNLNQPQRKLPLLIPAPTYGHRIPSHTLPHFTYFTSQILNTCTSPFNTGTFQRLILQLSHLEPCILNSILAISSLLKHQSKKHHPVVNVQSYKIESHVYFARAVRGLKRRLEGREEGKWEVAVVGSGLFAVFDLLVGCEESAGRNLGAGVEMLRVRLSFARPSPTLLSLSRPFKNFNHQLTTFDTFWSDPYTPLPTIPSSFTSLFEARDSLDDISAYIAAIFKPVKPHTQTLPYLPLPDHLSQNVNIVEDLLITWERKYDDLVTKRDKIGDISWQNGLMILKMSFLTTRISLQTLFYAEEDCYDVYLASFRTIITLAESILFFSTSPSSSPLSSCSSSSSTSKPNTTPQNRRETLAGTSTFTFEPSLIPSLYFAGLKCRDAQLRRKARELLNFCGIEGIWIGEAMGAVVGWVEGVERGEFTTLNPTENGGGGESEGDGSEKGSSDSRVGSRDNLGVECLEGDLGASTRLEVDWKSTTISHLGCKDVPAISRLRNLKVSVSKAGGCAFVVSRRKVFFSSSVPSSLSLYLRSMQCCVDWKWEYISGVVNWEESNNVIKKAGENKREKEKDEMRIRDMVVMYRTAMERLDAGLEGKE